MGGAPGYTPRRGPRDETGPHGRTNTPRQGGGARRVRMGGGSLLVTASGRTGPHGRGYAPRLPGGSAWVREYSSSRRRGQTGPHGRGIAPRDGIRPVGPHGRGYAPRLPGGSAWAGDTPRGGGGARPVRTGADKLLAEVQGAGRVGTGAGILLIGAAGPDGSAKRRGYAPCQASGTRWVRTCAGRLLVVA